MPSVSHSRADGYLLCRRKDYYGYTLSLQRVTESSSLGLGSAVHECLEALYKTILEAGNSVPKQKRAWKAGLKAMHDKYLEIVADGWEDADRNATLKDILRFYVDSEPFTRKGWLILGVEEEILLEYDPETESQFRLVIDLIAQDPQGKVAVIDHKTAWDFFSPEMAGIQGQIPKYIAALRGLGRKAHYGIYNMLRTRKIRGDKKLKGDLVRDLEMAGAEAHETVEVIDDEGTVTFEMRDKPLSKLSVADLTAMAKAHDIDLYSGPTSEQMHETMEIRPSATRVVRTFEEQVGVAAEISARELLPVEVIEKSAYRTANKMVCQSCSFRELCEAELRGDSTKLLLQTEYKTRERRPDIEVSEDMDT